MVVDPDGAELEPARGVHARPMSRVQTEAARPYSTSFAERSASSSSANALDGDDRAEHLALDDLGLLVGAGDHGRLEEVAALDRIGRRRRSVLWRRARARGRESPDALALRAAETSGPFDAVTRPGRRP